MTRRLDREGIFRARMLEWSVRESQQSSSVGIQFDFEILEELDGEKWVDWSEYEEHLVQGTWWVIKSDGTVNTKSVEQLAKATGWNGDLNAVFGAPPQCFVQITVKAEVYEGRTRYKAEWINPHDFQPAPTSADQGAVKQLSAKYGSLLRAAAGAAAPPKAAGIATKPTPAARPAPARRAAPAVAPAAAAAPAAEAPVAAMAGPEEDDIPF